MKTIADLYKRALQNDDLAEKTRPLDENHAFAQALNSATSTLERAQIWADRIQELSAAEEVDLLAKTLDVAMLLHPNSAKVLSAAALVYQDNGDWAKSYEAAEAALLKKPKLQDAQVAKAFALAAELNPSSGDMLFSEIADTAENKANVLLTWIDACLYRNDHRTAIEIVTRGIQEKPKNLKFYKRLLTVCKQTSNFTPMADAITNAPEKTKHSFDFIAHIKLPFWIVTEDTDQTTAALQSMRADLSKTTSSQWRAIAKAFLSVDDFQGVLDACVSGLTCAPDDYWHSLKRAYVLSVELDPVGGDALFCEIMETTQNPEDVLLAWTTACLERGDAEKAVQLAQRGIGIAPTNIEFYSQLLPSSRKIADKSLMVSQIEAAPAELSQQIAFLVTIKLKAAAMLYDDAAFASILAQIEARRDELTPKLSAKVGQNLASRGMWTAAYDYLSVAIQDKNVSHRIYAIYLTTLTHLNKDKVRPELIRIRERITEAKYVLILMHSGKTILERSDHIFIADYVRQNFKTLTSKQLSDLLMLLVMQADADVRQSIGEWAEFNDHDNDISWRLKFAAAHGLDANMLRSSGLSPVSWVGFEERSRAMATSYKTHLEKVRSNTQDAENIKDIEAIRAMLDATEQQCAFSKSCFYDAFVVAQNIRGAILHKKPLSLVRLGDGEGVFMEYPEPFGEFQTNDQIRIQVQTWWNERRFDSDTSDRMQVELAGVLDRAEIIGAVSNRLLTDWSRARLDRRKWQAIPNQLSRSLAKREKPALITSCQIHSDLDSWGLYEWIFQDIQSVSVISCHNLEAPLKERFGLDIRCGYDIPAENLYRQLFGKTETLEMPFYPAVFDHLMQDVDPEPGEVWLVAAGFLGKFLCDQIRARGGVAIDIGSLADHWMNHKTRRYFSTSARYGFANGFWDEGPFKAKPRPLPKDTNHTQPVKTDRSRRYNIAKPAEGDTRGIRHLPVLAVGHPRCGSNYFAKVLATQGLRLGHEKFGADGICSWLHTVNDMTPPPWTNAPSDSRTQYDLIIAHVRDPKSAIPSIMLENCIAESFDYRRFHIFRELGIDIAQLDDPISRAIESYLSWMELAQMRNPVATIRVEHAVEDLTKHACAFAASPLKLDPESLAAARAVPTTTNATTDKNMLSAIAEKPQLTHDDYAALSPDLLRRLDDFCERYGYSRPY